MSPEIGGATEHTETDPPSGPSRWLPRLESPVVARWVLAVGTLVAVAWWVWLGSKRWFLADDWSYLLYRDVLGGDGSLASRLFQPHNGHPVAVPALEFSVISSVFDWSSYGPYMVTSIVLHLVCGWLLWALLRRCCVTDLTASAVTVAVLLLGPATEFPTFASISSYQYSLIALLATMLIVDRYDDDSWAMLAAAGLGAATVLSSSFGLIFALAIALATVPRRRWRAAAIILIPQLTIYAWWWFEWGRGGADSNGSPLDAPEWAIRVAHRVFEAFAGPGFGPILLLATAAWGIALAPPSRARTTIVWPLAATAAAGIVLVGFQRSDFGLEDVSIGRYVVVFAFLLAPAVALAVDRVREIDLRLFVVVLALLCAATVVNLTSWRRGQLAVSDATMFDQSMLALLAGTDLGDVPLDLRPSRCSPDITLGHLPELVERGAVTPMGVSTADDEALIEIVLSGNVVDPAIDDPRPCAPNTSSDGP